MIKDISIGLSGLIFVFGIACLVLFSLSGEWHSLISGIFGTIVGASCLYFWLVIFERL